MKRNRIVVVTGSKEPSVGKPMELLGLGPCEVARINTDTLLQEGSFSLRTGQRGSSWIITVGDQEVDSRTIRSIWYRRPPLPKAPKASNRSFRRFIQEEMQKALWSLWTSSCEPILWMNHPTTSKLLEYNKSYQLGVAAKVGIAIPRTVVTSNPSVALSFIRECGGEGVIKVFGGNRLKNNDGEWLSIFTNRVTEQQILEGGNEIRCCPVMLENYVPKAIELRITVVGNMLFACAIHSQDSEKTRDDWRHYDFDNVKHEPFSLPEDIKIRLMRLMKALKINFGAIDMILTPQGEYVFLEVNPNGQWGWIEKLTGMPISQAIADVLSDSRKAIYMGPV